MAEMLKIMPLKIIGVAIKFWLRNLETAKGGLEFVAHFRYGHLLPMTADLKPIV